MQEVVCTMRVAETTSALPKEQQERAKKNNSKRGVLWKRSMWRGSQIKIRQDVCFVNPSGKTKKGDG